MTTAVSVALGLCIYLWASDWFRKEPGFMGGVFCGTWLALVVVTVLSTVMR